MTNPQPRKDVPLFRLRDIDGRQIIAGDIVILAHQHDEDLADGWARRLWYVQRVSRHTAILTSEGEPDLILDTDGVHELQAVTLGKTASQRICDNLEIS